MESKPSTTFEIKKWDEQPLAGPQDAPRMTQAHVEKTFSGTIEGESTLEYLMVYLDASSARYVGLERVTGRLDGRSGSFVLKHEGTFDDGIARSTLTVVPGTGTGELTGLLGTGSFETGPQQHVPMAFSYTLDDDGE